MKISAIIFVKSLKCRVHHHSRVPLAIFLLIVPCKIKDERVESEFEPRHGVQVYDNSDGDVYLDEPIADEAWFQEYRRKRQEDDETMTDL